jgi:hypothetical protein
MSPGKGNSPIVELSREELYEKIWSIPGSKLAKEFGISDVALAKICRKFRIPKPSRGYWARPEMGRKLSKPPLPSAPNPSGKIGFDVEANEARRAEWAIPQPNKEEITVETEIQLPPPDTQLHPLAKKVQALIANATADETGRVKIRAKDIPEIIASPRQADRILDGKRIKAPGKNLSDSHRPNGGSFSKI